MLHLPSPARTRRMLRSVSSIALIASILSTLFLPAVAAAPSAPSAPATGGLQQAPPQPRAAALVGSGVGLALEAESGALSGPVAVGQEGDGSRYIQFGATGTLLGFAAWLQW